MQASQEVGGKHSSGRKRREDHFGGDRTPPRRAELEFKSPVGGGANFSPLETFLVAEREGNKGNSGSLQGNSKYIRAADP